MLFHGGWPTQRIHKICRVWQVSHRWLERLVGKWGNGDPCVVEKGGDQFFKPSRLVWLALGGSSSFTSGSGTWKILQKKHSWIQINAFQWTMIAEIGATVGVPTCTQTFMFWNMILLLIFSGMLPQHHISKTFTRDSVNFNILWFKLM